MRDFFEELYGQCHGCNFRSVSVTTGKCCNCGARWPFEVPDRWAEVRHGEKSEEKRK